MMLRLITRQCSALQHGLSTTGARKTGTNNMRMIFGRSFSSSSSSSTVRGHDELGEPVISSSSIRDDASSRLKEPWESNLRGILESEKLQGKRADSWFTGVHPKYLHLDNGVLHSAPQPRLDNVTARQTKSYLDNTWTLTEILFSSLQGEEAFYRPPGHRLRHPMIFYYGHPACLYINKMLVAGVLKAPLNPYFEQIFEVGVDEMSWDDLNKYETIWPRVSEVHEYRKQTYNLIVKVIEDHMVKPAGGNWDKPYNIDMNHPLWSLFMGFEHERIHLETSSMLLRELPIHLLRKPEYFPLVHPEVQNYITHTRTTSPTPSSSSSSSSAKDFHLPIAGKDFPINEMIQISGGSTSIGKPTSFPSFGWDLEYGKRMFNKIPTFKTTKFLVSNGEYYEFVREGGYRSERFWSPEGWKWRRFRNVKWPLFWVPNGPQGSHRYKLRLLFDVTENMPWDLPVIVNLHEAVAFTNWKSQKSNNSGLRLLTEAEHMLMREKEHQHGNLTDPVNDPALNLSGKEFQIQNHANLNLAHGSEGPVHSTKPNSHGLHDVHGNVWHWLQDDANPLPGYKPHPYYDDFSSPCFDSEHKVIMGGSYISTGDAGANLHSRYHFRPHFYQLSGFRYVDPMRSERVPGEGIAKYLTEQEKRGGMTNSNVVMASQAASFVEESKRDQSTYESRALVHQYLGLHYGQYPSTQDEVFIPHANRANHALLFPQRCAELIVKVAKQVQAPMTRALDLGCATGASTLELSKSYSGEVVGLDLSSAFIKAAIRVQSTGSCEFRVPVEGKVESPLITVNVLKEMKLSKSEHLNRVKFLVGDACDVRNGTGIQGEFDAILMGNLLCRVPSPRKCLDQMPSLVSKHGILALASPYSWLSQFSKEEEWFGGREDSLSSAMELNKYMIGLGFKLVHEENIPALIREHQRKYQYIVPHFTVYQKL